MTLHRVLEGHRIVPVVVIDDAAQAVELAEALLGGGIGCAEFTLRTPAAVEAIRLAAEVPGFLSGAGTVLSPSDVEAVSAAGARFMVAPDLSMPVVEAARDADTPLLPGVATAGEVHRALDAGLDVLKLFPADAVGGASFLKSIRGPFADARFVPSGGVDSETFVDYLRQPNVFAVSGSWIAPRDLIAAGAFSDIERRAAHAVSRLREAHGS